jgi:TRAP-type C4-dicarboxylate transport system permease small subunit
MKKLIAILEKTDSVVTVAIKWLTIAMFLALSLIVTATILLRIFPITSLHWTDEIVELCFAALVFYGAAGVWMVKGHFSVGDWMRKAVKSDRAYNCCRLFLELITLAFILIFFRYSLNLTLRAREVTSVFQIPKKILYSCMPISSLIMVVYSLVYVVRCAIGTVSPKALEKTEPK